MAKEITITNGEGSANIANGDYSVTFTSTGYDSLSINPSSVTISNDVTNYSFTISGSGTLEIHVSEDGTGLPIIGAQFARTDSLGNIYGDTITTNSSGIALLEHLPYDSADAPVVYFKQISSDGSHEFLGNVLQTRLNSSTKTYEVTNTLATLRTIKLTDVNYNNLPIESAIIKLS